MEKINRSDLLNKTSEQLNKNYRICSDHFEPCMFSNPERNWLYEHAEPTFYYADCTKAVKRSHEVAKCEGPSAKRCLLSVRKPDDSSKSIKRCLIIQKHYKQLIKLNYKIEILSDSLNASARSVFAY